MRYAIAASCLAVAGAGCSKKVTDGLPPTSEWQAASGGVAVAVASGPLPPPPVMGGLPRKNPHAGLDLPDPGDPHAGLSGAGAGDPHAGLDGMASNPHAIGGTDVTALGLAPPDPDRAIDPSRRIAGTITLGGAAGQHMTAGTAVFLTVKRVGPDGAPTGQPLAVDKLTWSGDGMAFELTEENAMLAGTDLSGDVIVMARYDQDSDALSKQPGDVTGQVRVRVPAERVQLRLDTVLR